jgi:hypothetical protein
LPKDLIAMSEGTDEYLPQPEPATETPLAENVDPAKEFNQYMGTSIDRPDKDFIAEAPKKPAKRYSKDHTKKLYKEAGEWKKKRDAAVKEKDSAHSFTPTMSYKMKNAGLS